MIDSAIQFLEKYQIVGSVAGFILAVMSIFKTFFVKRPFVELRLLKDIYFRFTSNGGLMFNNLTLINRGALAEVKDIRLNVKKLGDNSRDFNYKINIFGKKEGLVNGTRIKDNVFDSTSPTEFLRKNHIINKVTVASVPKYSGKVGDIFKQIDKECNTLRIKRLNVGQSQEEEIIQEYLEIYTKYKSKFESLISIEEGKYIVESEVSVKATHYPWKWGNPKKVAKLEFEITDKLIEKYINDIDRFILDYLYIFVFQDKREFVYPNLIPINIKEID